MTPAKTIRRAQRHRRQILLLIYIVQQKNLSLGNWRTNNGNNKGASKINTSCVNQSFKGAQVLDFDVLDF
jgi:hypothetical protein